ncbi:MAG: hypothetical protein R6V61_13435 [Wenzhouxiangellaceae bacterium]
MNRLIVHLPLLESLPGGAERLPPEMRRMLQRGDRFECGAREALAMLLQSAPLPAPAVLSRLAGYGDQSQSSGWWLRFDPVRLIPDLTAVWLDRAMPLDFGSAAMRPVVEELQTMFRAEGLQWDPEPGDRFGLLGLDEDPACSFSSPDEVHGKRLDDVLPEGPGRARWRGMVNESQMIFHQFRPLSRADQQGVGLWFWGPGTMPAPASPGQPLRVVDGAGSARVRGLANWLDVPLVDSETRFDEVVEPACLVHWPLQSTDLDTSLERLGRDWLAPADRAQRRGRLAEILVVGSTGYWRLGRFAPIMFWRRQARGFETSGSAG